MWKACNMHRRETGAYGLPVEKPKGKILLGRPRHRWEDNIEIEME
jgi:hypothetical protein